MINISRFANSITEYTMKNWKIVLKQELEQPFFYVKRWGKVLYIVKETIGIINYILSLEAGIT
jgi:hypothetical protein